MDKHTEKDGLLIALLALHRGKSQAITAGEISKHMNEWGFSIKPHSVGNTIRSLMLAYNLPICGVNGEGYYWATTDAEIQGTIADLESRRTALSERIAHLKKFVKGGESP